MDEVDSVVASLDDLGDDAGTVDALQVLGGLLGSHVHELHINK